MKKLGEQVYQFQLVILSPKADVLFFAVFLLPLCFLAFLFSFEIIGAILCLLGSIPGIWLFKLYWRNVKTNGLILDKKKGIISIYKWTWSLKKPQLFDDIPISEIISVNEDVTVETETKIVNDGIGAVGMQTYYKKKAVTTENITYTIVFQGKFGVKKVNIWKRDDFFLFFTLYNDSATGESQSASSAV